MQKFETPTPIAAVLDIPAGRVQFIAFAEFRGVGRLGDVALEAYGVVKIDEAASIRLTAYAGDVAVSRLTGPAEISTQQGDIQITEAVSGTVVLTTQMGDVAVGAAPGLNIRATTSHGDIVAHSL